MLELSEIQQIFFKFIESYKYRMSVGVHYVCLTRTHHLREVSDLNLILQCIFNIKL